MESVRCLAGYLAERGMPTTVAHLTREHIEAYMGHVLANRKRLRLDPVPVIARAMS